jgi:hypothetical protein
MSVLRTKRPSQILFAAEFRTYILPWPHEHISPASRSARLRLTASKHVRLGDVRTPAPTGPLPLPHPTMRAPGLNLDRW